MKHFIFTTLALTSISITSCSTKSNDTVINANSIDSLLALSPDSIPYLLYKAELLSNDYKFYEALEYAAKAYRMDTTNIESRYLYAKALNNKENRTINEVALAQRHYLYIIKHNPKDYKAMVQLATTYGYMQDFENAFLHVNNALRLNDKYADAYVYKGTLYRANGKMDLAKSSYETAIQMDPNYFEAYLFLATIFLDENNPIALEYYKTAYELKSVPEVLYAYAFAFDKLNKMDGAKENYRLLASNKDPFYASVANFHLGYIKQIKETQIDSALFFYSKAIHMNNDYVEAYHNRGMCYELKKDYVSARADYLTALKFDPDFQLSIDAFNKIEKK